MDKFFEKDPTTYHNEMVKIQHKLWCNSYDAVKVYGKKKEKKDATEWTLTFGKKDSAFIKYNNELVRLKKAVVRERPDVQVRDSINFWIETKEGKKQKAEHSSLTCDFDTPLNIYSIIWRKFAQDIWQNLTEK